MNYKLDAILSLVSSWSQISDVKKGEKVVLDKRKAEKSLLKQGEGLDGGSKGEPSKTMKTSGKQI